MFCLLLPKIAAISYILNIKAFRTFFKVVVKPMVYADK